MNLFMTHTDTPYRLYQEKLHLSSSKLHCSKTALASFERADVVFAFWSHYGLSDEEAWHTYLAMQDNFSKELPSLPPSVHPIYAIEDARMLGTDTERCFDILLSHGVKVLTPLWRGESVVGGAYDTDTGLAPKGVEICASSLARGMTLDISHASEASAQDMVHLAKKYGMPVIASHSNFFSVYPHRRNLTDHLAKEVAYCGGIIGLSFVPSHLGEAGTVEDLICHIEHGISLGLEDHLVLGTDYDGTDTLPEGISHGVQDLHPLYDRLLETGLSKQFLEKLFFRNASAFFGHLQ